MTDIENDTQKLSKPLLVVLAAPSGAGKSTLCGMLLEEFPEFLYSVSCTTRKPRGAEVNGVSYFFLTEEQFRCRIDANEFLEYAVVHGNYYGTLKKTIADAMAAGRSVILDIDVEGAAQVRTIVLGLPDEDPMKAGYLDVFINAPSFEVLRSRLVKRGEDAMETIEKRLENASAEMVRAREFSHVLVNERVEETYLKFRNIVLAAAAQCRGCMRKGKRI